MKRNFYVNERKALKSRENNRNQSLNNKKKLLDKLKKSEELKKQGFPIALNNKNIKSDKAFKRDLRKQQKKVRVYNKRVMLSIDFPDALTNLFSDNQIDKISFTKIKNHDVYLSRNGKIWLDGNDRSNKLDYNKKYKLSSPFRLAFVDWSENMTLGEAVSMFKDKSYEKLLENLKEVVSKNRTGPDEGSKGKPGTALFEYGNNSYLKTVVRNAAMQTRKWRKKSRQHTPERTGWQWLTLNGNQYIDEISPKQALIICNAIMHNTSEEARENFYHDFYNFIKGEIPEIEIPKPRFTW